MKKFYSFLFAAAALVGFAACSTDEGIENVAPEQEGVMEFVASFDETRTTLDGMDVKWCESDQISVNGEVFSIKEGSISDDGKSATFVGNKVERPYKAKYPANVEAVTSNVAANTFADGANIAFAYSEENETLSFNNALAVLKYQVAAKCNEITISANKYIAGRFTVDEKNCAITEIGSSDEDKTMTLSIDGGFKPGVDYYTTINAQSELALDIYVDDVLVVSKGAKDIVKNTIYNLGVLTLPTPEYTVYVTAQPKSDASMWENFNLYTWVEGGIGLDWPGTDITANTKEINGYTYHYYTYPAEYNGQDVNVIVNNGTGKQTADINLGTLDKDYYVVYSTSMNEVYTEAPAAGSIEEAPTAVDPKPETVSIYLKTNWGWSDWALHAWYVQDGNDMNWTGEWPGKAKEYDEEIAGVIYKAWDVPAAVIGQTGTQIIITGKEWGETKQTHNTPVTFTEGEDVFVEITGWDSDAGMATLTVIANPY